MKIRSDSIVNATRIPARFAMGRPADPATFSDNISPHLAWDEVPEGTRSFALLFVDDTVPTRGDDVNQPGRLVPAGLPRTDFYHWVLVDLPAETRELPEGAGSSSVTPHGKPCGPAAGGITGANDYTSWFAGSPDMQGDYGGYDGPFPPWNDERVHYYHLRLFALDVASLGLSGPFRGGEVLEAVQGHVLAEATLSATYAIYDRAF